MIRASVAVKAMDEDRDRVKFKVEAVGRGGRGGDLYWRRDEVYGEGGNRGKGGEADNGHGDHLQHDNDNNNSKRLVAVKVICLWGGKGERKNHRRPSQSL